VTTDTSVVVTPTFTFKHHPCAYNLQPFTLSIPYADECGNPALRTFMRGEEQPFAITAIWPDPLNGEHGVTIGYVAHQPGTILSVASSADGGETGRSIIAIQDGTGQITIPATLLPKSGVAFITLEARDMSGTIRSRQTVKVSTHR